MKAPQTTPAALERVLVLEMLRGSHAPGSRLPTVRALAARFDVNPSTIQRVVARLEARGLVTARQGSGLHVADPWAAGDLSLLPFWLEATLDDPPRAAAVLADFLEVRRVLAARLVARHRDRLLARATDLAHAALQFQRAIAEGDLDGIREADLAFAHTLVEATGNRVAQGILNASAVIVRGLPDVAHAMYADARLNAATMADVVSAFGGDPDALGALVERALAVVDAATVRRFRERLVARAVGNP
ncbi:MAG: FadR family transcriptional regulator [Myxococcales bacterium]|nr:FadR family transcriptional regulator [Myxococcales bacterium]